MFIIQVTSSPLSTSSCSYSYYITQRTLAVMMVFRQAVPVVWEGRYKTLNCCGTTKIIQEPALVLRDLKFDILERSDPLRSLQT